MLDPLLLQVYGGALLLTLTVWQLATGLRWIKLGKRHYRIHRYTGISLLVLGALHGLNGLNIAFGIFRFLP